MFTAEELPRLLPAPADRYVLPVYATPKVHRDHQLLTEPAGTSTHVSGVIGVSRS